MKILFFFLILLSSTFVHADWKNETTKLKIISLKEEIPLKGQFITDLQELGKEQQITFDLRIKKLPGAICNSHLPRGNVIEMKGEYTYSDDSGPTYLNSTLLIVNVGRINETDEYLNFQTILDFGYSKFSTCYAPIKSYGKSGNGTNKDGELIWGDLEPIYFFWNSWIHVEMSQSRMYVDYPKWITKFVFTDQEDGIESVHYQKSQDNWSAKIFRNVKLYAGIGMEAVIKNLQIKSVMDEDKNESKPITVVCLSVGLGLSILLNAGTIILIGRIFLKKSIDNSQMIGMK